MGHPSSLSAEVNSTKPVRSSTQFHWHTTSTYILEMDVLEDFQLGAIAGQHLYRIPMHRGLQNTLANTWQAQLNTFLAEVDEVDFDPGYNPDPHELFRLARFDLPAFLGNPRSLGPAALDSIGEGEDF